MWGQWPCHDQDLLSRGSLTCLGVCRALGATETPGGGTGGTAGDAHVGGFVPVLVALPDTPPPLGTNAAPVWGHLGCFFHFFGVLRRKAPR